MHWKRYLSVVLICCGVAVAGSATASDAFEKKLREADTIRSSQPNRFALLLQELQKESATATTLQKQRLRYLRAYETAMYRDRMDEASEMARALYNETKNTDLKYRSGGLIANLSAINRDFRVGLRYINRIQVFRHKVHEKSIRHEGIAAGAILYNQLGQYGLALNYANDLLKDQPSPRTECLAQHVRLESLFELKRLSSTDPSIDKAIHQCSASMELVQTNLIRAILAKQLAAEGKTDEAIVLLEKHLAQVQSTNYPRLIAEIDSILAGLKLTKGDHKAAKKHAEAAVALGNEIKSTMALVNAYHALYRIADYDGDQTSALALYKQYAEADIARLNDVKARDLAYEIVRHEGIRDKQQIQLLERNNQLLRLQRTLERENTLKAQMATIFLILLAAGIAYWAFEIKRHQGQLRKLAQTDALTALSNRHYFTQLSESALIECARAGEQAALVMFDLDHFKAINDTYGHGAGDWVLREIGRVCAAHCRKVDDIGRLGGEEFAIFLRGLDVAGAVRLAEDCRSHIAQIDTKETGFSFVVTASFGVTSTALSGYDLSRLLSHADQMLYCAKKEGRNRVCKYSADEVDVDRTAAKRAPTLTVVQAARD